MGHALTSELPKATAGKTFTLLIITDNCISIPLISGLVAGRIVMGRAYADTLAAGDTGALKQAFSSSGIFNVAIFGAAATLLTEAVVPFLGDELSRDTTAVVYFQQYVRALGIGIFSMAAHYTQNNLFYGEGEYGWGFCADAVTAICVIGASFSLRNLGPFVLGCSYPIAASGAVIMELVARHTRLKLKLVQFECNSVSNRGILAAFRYAIGPYSEEFLLMLSNFFSTKVLENSEQQPPYAGAQQLAIIFLAKQFVVASGYVTARHPGSRRACNLSLVIGELGGLFMAGFPALLFLFYPKLAIRMVFGNNSFGITAEEFVAQYVEPELAVLALRNISQVLAYTIRGSGNNALPLIINLFSYGVEVLTFTSLLCFTSGISPGTAYLIRMGTVLFQLASLGGQYCWSLFKTDRQTATVQPLNAVTIDAVETPSFATNRAGFLTRPNITQRSNNELPKEAEQKGKRWCTIM